MRSDTERVSFGLQNFSDLRKTPGTRGGGEGRGMDNFGGEQDMWPWYSYLPTYSWCISSLLTFNGKGQTAKMASLLKPAELSGRNYTHWVFIGRDLSLIKKQTSSTGICQWINRLFYRNFIFVFLPWELVCHQSVVTASEKSITLSLLTLVASDWLLNLYSYCFDGP